MMHLVDPNKMETYRKGNIPKVISNQNVVAGYYKIPTINLAKEVMLRIDNEVLIWEDDFKNSYSSPFGQGIYAHSMIEFLESSYSKHLDNDDKIILRTQELNATNLN